MIYIYKRINVHAIEGKEIVLILLLTFMLKKKRIVIIEKFCVPGGKCYFKDYEPAVYKL